MSDDQRSDLAKALAKALAKIDNRLLENHLSISRTSGPNVSM
jgi:hypothetical protein